MLSFHRLEQLAQPMLLEVDHIRRALASHDAALDVFAPGWYGQRNPAGALEQFVRDEACDAWILVRSGAPVQHWFSASGLPCLIRGYPYPGVSLPHLDVDWEATARHAAATLWRHGHRRVAILIPPDRLQGVEAAIRGVNGFDEDGFSTLPLDEDGTVDGIKRVFQRMLRHQQPPTGLIAVRTRQVATVLGCAAQAGPRVPDDLSIVSLAREPFLEQLVPEITGYRVDADAVAREVVRRLFRMVSGQPLGKSPHWITPEVVKGGSVAPPRR